MKLPWTWTVLFALLALLLVGALTLDRSAWPSLVGDEATYLMQAESLAWDGDLVYGAGDYERFVRLRGTAPEGLILQSGDGGRTITFGKPFFYALYLAPFVRLAPLRGPFVANALLVMAAAVLAAESLRRRLGNAAPLWVASLLFASVTFAYTFWVHPDLFLMCLVAIALALAFDPLADADRPRRAVLHWAVAGLLLAVVGFSRPMYATLFLPAFLAVPAKLRRRGGVSLLGGGLALVAVAVLVHQELAGSYTSYGASRRGFYSYTGYPDVDFPAADWGQNLADWGDHAWLGAGDAVRRKVVPSLWGWNAVYFLVGRDVGLLPYFLPFLLAFAAPPKGWARWGLLVALALVAAAFLHLRPFNFWGGGGAIGNRYLLPLYPALWFVASRPLRAWWVAAVTLVAGLFLAPLWLAPRDFPLLHDGAYRYVSPVARWVLPYETTQSHLKPSGQEDVRHGGLWIKFLDRGVEAIRQGERLRLTGRGTILVGYPEPLEALEIDLRMPPEATFTVSGGKLRELPAEGAWRRFELVLDGPRARHPMWWTWDRFYLYSLGLEVDGTGGEPVALRMRTR